jgi:hypothetical protein
MSVAAFKTIIVHKNTVSGIIAIRPESQFACEFDDACLAQTALTARPV